jgi:hypothetical protein
MRSIRCYPGRAFMRMETCRWIAPPLLAAALLTSSATATAATAADLTAPGFEVGARLGYGFSAGSTGAAPNVPDNDVSSYVSGQWPIWLDAGYRFGGPLYLGGFFQYGFGTVNNADQNGCRNANVDCSASDMRLGIMGRYRLPAIMLAQPWLGLGVGYEWGSFSVRQSVVGNTNTDASWSGFEFANLQGGADFRIAQKVALGPFISFSLGQFQSTSTTTTNGNTSTTTERDLTDKSLHEWFLVGARVAFMP